jgi:hypothetical protein
MGISLLLVLATLIKGFKFANSTSFLFIECLLNLTVLLDFLARVRLMGMKRFIEGGFWNIFDAVVVFGCVFLFLLMLVSSSLSLLIFEEVSEEILLIGWSLFQTLRMIFIAKKQKLAHQSAKTLIDFSNIGLDTEAGEIHNEDHVAHNVDEVIVFDMKKVE